MSPLCLHGQESAETAKGLEERSCSIWTQAGRNQTWVPGGHQALHPMWLACYLSHS